MEANLIALRDKHAVLSSKHQETEHDYEALKTELQQLMDEYKKLGAERDTLE